MKITTLVPPAAPPVALSEARAFLRVGYDGEDLMIAEMLHAATARIEMSTALRLMPQTVRVDLPAWPETALAEGCLRLPLRPVRAISAIIANGVDVTGDFELTPDSWPHLAPLEAWPGGGEGVAITLDVGFASAEDVPDDLLLAHKLILAQAYRAREDGSDEGLGRDIAALLSPWRRVKL